MPSSARNEKIVSDLRLRTLPAPEPWQCLLLRVSEFPMPENELFPLRELLSRLSRSLLRQPGFSSHVFIQLEKLHLADGPSRLATNGRSWLPEMGLGVRPEQPAPSLWTKADLENIEPGYEPRNLVNQVFRVTAGGEMTHHARDRMLGLGTVIEIFSGVGIKAILDRGRAVFLPKMSEPAFQSFPFYVPLFSASTFSSGSEPEIVDWACGISACVRESPEDGGVLLASITPIRDRVEQLWQELSHEAQV